MVGILILEDKYLQTEAFCMVDENQEVVRKFLEYIELKFSGLEVYIDMEKANLFLTNKCQKKDMI